MTTEVILAIVSAMLMVIGLVGVFAPVLPGVPLSLAGFILYAWGTHFEKLSVATTIVFSVLCLISIGLDAIAQYVGAKKFNATKAGTIGLVIGMVVGLFFAPWGFILGPVLGAFIGEYIVARDFKQAAKSAAGSIIGTLCSSAVKMILIIVMGGFLIAAIF